MLGQSHALFIEVQGALKGHTSILQCGDCRFKLLKCFFKRDGFHFAYLHYFSAACGGEIEEGKGLWAVRRRRTAHRPFPSFYWTFACMWPSVTWMVRSSPGWACWILVTICRSASRR